MRRLLLAACLTIFGSQQGLALSCMMPTIEGSFIEHSEAEESFILVSGRLIKKRGVVRGPKIQGGLDQRSENFTATFVGHQATRSGFDRPFKATIAISTNCAGPWCGSVALDTPMITFLEVTPYGHKLGVGPCAGNMFYNPTKAQKRSVLQCLRGGVCKPDFR